MKRDLYEGGIRVPLIAWWPGHVAANAQNDLLSGFQDIFPTLAEAAGIAYPNTDGLSLLPTLLGEPGQRHHDSLYWETHERHGIRALRKGFWKAIQHHFLREPEGSVELYDLSIDPKESKNIASDHAIITSELKRLMDLAHEPRNDPGH
jgi:arylsulfatase A-like enzyme